MKIQLSPWVVTETTSVFPKKRRRTTRNVAASAKTTSVNGVDQELPIDFPVVASFLKNDPDSPAASWKPRMSLTFSHKVSILGSSSAAPADAEDSFVAYLEENAAHQYLTRSAIATCFFPTITADCVKKRSSLPRIPCLCVKSRLYAMMNENTQLVSWRTDQTPDEGFRIDLRSPALSLSYGSDGHIFGACQDGSLFVAPVKNQLTTVDRNLCEMIMYLRCVELPSSAMHVASLSKRIAHDIMSQSQSCKSRSKFFLSQCYYQIFFDASQLFIVRHTPHLESNALEEYSVPLSATYTTQCLGCTLHSQYAHCTITQPDAQLSATTSTVSDVHFVGFNHRDEAVLAYTVTAGETDKSSSSIGFFDEYCCRISLSQARVLNRNKLILPHQGPQHRVLCRRMTLVGSLLALVAPSMSSPSERFASLNPNGESLYLYDALRGGFVSQHALDEQATAFDQLGCMISDGRESIALVGSRNNSVCVALVSIRTAQGVHSRSPIFRLSLAQSLSARRIGLPHYHLLFSEETHVREAIILISNACAQIRMNSTNPKVKSFLFKSYTEAATVALSICSNWVNGLGDDASDGVRSDLHVCVGVKKDQNGAINHQEPSEFMNGANSFNPKRKNYEIASHMYPSLKGGRLRNGLTRNTKSPIVLVESKHLPVAFMEVTISKVLELLLSPLCSEDCRDDARLIIRGCVRSGKLSARRVFGRLAFVLVSMETSTDSENVTTSYSPVDFVFDMFRFCKNVSEHQTVAALQYLLSRALPTDTYAFLKRNAIEFGLQCDSVLLLDDWKVSVDQRKLNVNLERQLAKLSNKILLLAVTTFILNISMYSEFNEMLLKNATEKILVKTELAMLSRILTYLATNKPLTVPGKLFVMKWLTVVCEVLRRSSDSESDTRDIVFAREAISMEVRVSDRALVLKSLIDSAMNSAKKMVGVTDLATQPAEPDRTSTAYRIERLVY